MIWLVSQAIHRSGWLNDISLIISGGARGIDLASEQFAQDYSIPVRNFIPDWDKYGKAAGVFRNEDMAKEADALILVWDGSSRGSKNMLENAKKYNLKIYEHIII